MRFRVQTCLGHDVVIESDHIAVYTRKWGNMYDQDMNEKPSDELMLASGGAYYLHSDSANKLWEHLNENL